MSKGKRLVLALVLLVTFCTVAIAASPKVDSILQEHDVLVPFFLPRTLFTITPQGDDVTWSISRKNGDEWEDATVSWDQSTPLQGEIGADDGQQRIWWNFKNYGDNTGHDGGVTHRLDVKVNGETVTQVDFDVTYVPELGLDYISLRDWKTEEDLKAARYAWYNKAEVCSFGPQFKEACDELTDEWYRFSVVDLSQQGTQVFDMIANDTWHLGYVTVTEQVIVNLLENSVLHGKTTTLIKLTLSSDGENAVFSVADNGSGINEKKLPMLFSGYFIHAEEQSGDVKRNMGIGLSVCLTIIKAHGGTMTAGNLPEGGAEFTFTLPLERAL